MSRNWYPVIDKEKCILCGKCYKKCESGVYNAVSMILTSNPPQDGGYIQIDVINPDGCGEGCEGCSKECPVGAITYVDNRLFRENSSCDGNCKCKEGE